MWQRLKNTARWLVPGGQRPKSFKADMAAIQKDVKTAITSKSKQKLDEALSKHNNLILGEVVKSGTLEMVVYLLERHPRPQEGEIYALYQAGLAGNTSVFRHVLKRNPDVDFSAPVPGCGKIFPSSLAEMLEQSARPIWAILRDHGQPGIVLAAALEADDLRVFREILAANPTLRPDISRVLERAVRARLEFWAALLEHDARLAYEEFGNGEAANILGVVVDSGNLALLKMMVERGVDITAGRYHFVRVVYLAKMTGEKQIFDLLVENGAKLEEDD